MIKKVILLGLTTMLISCASPSTDEQFAEAARSRDCTVSSSTYQNTMTAYYKDCSIEFMTFEDTREAEERYYDLLEIGKDIDNKTASTVHSEMNFPWHHHYMVKSSSHYFYLTQIGNTVLYTNGVRRCETKVEEVADIIHY